MRFSDVRRVPAPADAVWAALHDSDALRDAIPGCERLTAIGAGRYGATLGARVGLLSDTYRGTFVVEDVQPGRELVVSVAGDGRCGSLEVDLRVCLDGVSRTSTQLAYDAHARVSGLVSRLGRAPLAVAGAHITGCFFHDLERTVRRSGVSTSHG